MNEFDLVNEIDDYYVVKSKYEKKYDVNKSKISKSGKLRNLTKEQLRKEVLKLKHHCIFCDSDKGMTFTSVKSPDDTFRELSYTCRKPEPCTNKTVKFLLGKHVDELIASDRDAYNEGVDSMLKAKYDLLFDYVVNNDLKTLTGNYNGLKDMLSTSLEESMAIKMNPEVRDKIRLLDNQLRTLVVTNVTQAEIKEKFNKIVELENTMQSMKHPTLSILEKDYTFDHPYTLHDLFFYNSID